jgi:hypothetical protein
MKDWEIIADNLSKGGWSWGCVSAIDSNRRTIWIVDAHRDNGKRFVAHADEKLTAFLELESRRLGLAANCLDALTRLFQTRRRLSGSEPRRRTPLPARFFVSSGPAIPKSI